MDEEGGLVVIIFVIIAIGIFAVGIIANILEILFGFFSGYSIWFYGLGGILIAYGLFLQVGVQKEIVEKEKVDQLSKSLNAQLDQSQQRLNQGWRNWED